MPKKPKSFTLSLPDEFGFHHFRIRQRSGSFFFHSLTVWKVQEASRT